MPASAEVPKDVLDTLQSTKARITELRREVESLVLSTGSDVDSLPPLQQAQRECARVRAALALSECIHSLHGESSEYVDMMQSERTMLTAYEKKIKAAVAKQELGRKKRGMEINVDAAHRFISHAIPDLSEAQKAELQQVAAGAASRRDGIAKVSRLATEPDPHKKGADIAASKGTSAVERARKRARHQEAGASAATAATNPLDMLDDMFKDV